MIDNDFIKQIKKYQILLTKHEMQTLRGQVIKGDVEAAKKGLNKIIRKRVKAKES